MRMFIFYYLKKRCVRWFMNVIFNFIIKGNEGENIMKKINTHIKSWKNEKERRKRIIVKLKKWKYKKN